MLSQIILLNLTEEELILRLRRPKEKVAEEEEAEEEGMMITTTNLQEVLEELEIVVKNHFQRRIIMVITETKIEILGGQEEDNKFAHLTKKPLFTQWFLFYTIFSISL
ncbi:hypothetical protein T190607A01A_70057 [Tenacibaculum sp. 190524A05c]|uniref:Uncharacterized protein n=1 Tax=Tenacibaculum platacis TaxID=3137852 RepID=A0ABP1ERG0_9FLAO